MMTGCGPLAREPEPLPVPGAATVPHRRDKVEFLHEGPRVCRSMMKTLAGRGGNLGGPPAPADGWAGGVRADHGGVDVSVPVDLGRAEKADDDPAGLQPVGEDLGHGGTNRVDVSARSPVADRQGSRVGLEPMQPDS